MSREGIPAKRGVGRNSHLIACSFAILWIILAVSIHISIYEIQEKDIIDPNLSRMITFNDFQNATEEQSEYVSSTEDFNLDLQSNPQRAIGIITITIAYEETEITDLGECDTLNVTLILDEVNLNNPHSQSYEIQDCNTLEFEFKIRDDFSIEGTENSGWDYEIREKWEDSEYGTGKYTLRISVGIEKGNQLSQDDGEEVNVSWKITDYSIPVEIGR